MKKITAIAFCAAALFPLLSKAQDMTVFQSNMRSRAVSQLNQEEYQRIGVYKVKGNSYFLKGANVCDVFTTLGYASNVPLVFDIYKQEVGILLENRKDMAKMKLSELDSFIVKIDNDKVFTEPAFFINTSRIESSKKNYMQRLIKGSQYTLYKSYKAELKPAALDVAQTNVMQFETTSEYFYTDSAAPNDLVKIKTNLDALKSKFKDKPEYVEILKKITKENFETELVSFFEKINAVLPKQ